MSAVLLLFHGLLICFLGQGCRPATLTPAERADAIEQAISNKDLQRAKDLATAIPEDSAFWLETRTSIAESLTKAGQMEEAKSWYQQIIDQRPQTEDAYKALYYQSELERETGHLAKAEAGYRKVLKSVGEDVATRERLAFILSATGRTWDATPDYLALVMSGTATPIDLCLLADLERNVDQFEYIKSCRQKAPDDPIVQLGYAAHLFWEGDNRAAESALREVLAAHPEYLAGQAMLGELLVTRDVTEFLNWHSGLPANALEHPRVWLSYGLWARNHQDLPVAARCFWESLRREPTGRRAVTQLSQILPLLNHPAADEFQNRARQLSRLTQLIDQILQHNAQLEPPIREVAQILDDVGRTWEACGWGVLAQRQFANIQWQSAIFARHNGELTPELPLVSKSGNLATKFDLSNFPGPDSLVDQMRKSVPVTPIQAKVSRIRFEEHGVVSSFIYRNGNDPQTRGARMFEQTGGGVCVLDYDRDGRPDLMFPQGCQWPTGQVRPIEPPSDRDTLFRHVAAGTARDVTADAFPADIGFGQGVASGDIDNDGFPDLYVGNIGRNQILRNLGDGTFEDISESAGQAPDAWTASTVIADLNADGIPDLFDVNYVTGPNVYELICQNRACSPKVFQGTVSQLHLGQGDGTFRTVPYGPDCQPGKGLGAVCLPIDSLKYPSLFISNDQVANQLLRNHPLSSGAGFELIDEAMSLGTAYNGDGVAMAGMGIAADDVDGNGLTDLFVTNFKDEPNTLYLQDSPGLFVDSTNAYGLKAASLSMVGWGTQFVDADRDARPDLVLVNGHVDDYRDAGGEFEMRSQLFRQEADGRFVELFSPDAGEFFGALRRGRGLARLDWNQDGLMDFAVSSIEKSASLVLNATADAGSFLNLRFVATRSARDATGTKVTVVLANGKSWTKSLLSGDGYMASNERILQFGLGDATEIQEVVVDWPSGSVSHIEKPAVNQTILLVEGDRAAWPVGPQAKSGSIKVVSSFGE